jgi:hypothetical protein
MARSRLRVVLASGLACWLVACGSSSAGGGSGGTTVAGTGGVPGSGGAGGTTLSSPAGGLGPWSLTADYPLAANDCLGTPPDFYCDQQTCVASSGYAYCIGGGSTSTYYSQLSPAGMGPWIATADYPEPVQEASCVVNANSIYCVGGRIGATYTLTADVYYAPLLSPGIGAWTASTPFPEAARDLQCMVDSGYIYCISVGSAAYFAPLSSNGVGAWAPTTMPPAGTRCSSVAGYAYCVGQAGCPPNGPASDCYSPSAYAPLTASGIGTWLRTSELPTAVSAMSAFAGPYVYYLSIPVFFAKVSADGIGPWQTTTNYPDSLYPANCFSDGINLYCASGVAASSYFAPIGAPNPQAFQLQDAPPFPRSEYLMPASTREGTCSVSVNGVGAGAPCFGKNIDEAAVLTCGSEVSTPSGCKTTVASADAAYNYDVTVWYPCKGQTPANANCCFLPALGYPDPFDAWCISIGSNSFIIAQQITMQEGQ